MTRQERPGRQNGSIPVMVAILAHPDDESFPVGGTLAKYAAEGIQVDLIMATRGEAGIPGLSSEKAATIREAELRCACAELGVANLPADGCRRSKKVLAYLDEQQIRHMRIELASSEGQALAKEYDLRASPGILVDGTSVNPFDILEQPTCQIKKGAAQELFGLETKP